MTDRYEIRGRLGQGGVGTVYRAFDKQLNREVAIKRIVTGEGKNTEQAARQLAKEASTLSTLQHPNVVTVYDVGNDEDGPYVVMEILNGRTVEEVVENQTFTWNDFREFALQTQEALIAAQDLGLVHRDIKPGNVMLSWLPSGKFQVKLLDFGLAKYSPKPALQTIDHRHSVFGSIYFMAPEQFERAPLDCRTDMYAMGCVYYFVLAGVYPYQGDTGPQVMAAHIDHRVTPLHELRPDLPTFACDWVMWHINRYQDDRPFNAREALQQLLSMEAGGTAPAAAPAQPQRGPSIVIPGGGAPANYQTGPVPAPGMPTTGVHQVARPNPQTGTQPVPVPQAGPRRPAAPPQKQTSTQPVPVPGRQTGPVPPHTGPVPTQTGPVAAFPTAGVPTATSAHPVYPTKAAPAANKKKLYAMIGGGAAALVVVGLLATAVNSSRKSSQVNALIDKGRSGQVDVKKDDVELLLAVVTSEKAGDRTSLNKALFNAKSVDGTDLDAQLAEIATTANLSKDAREGIFRDVLGPRGKSSAVPALLRYVGRNGDASAAALEATAEMANDENFDDLLNILRTTGDESVRTAAENALRNVLKRSSNVGKLGEKLSKDATSAPSASVRYALIRLLGSTGSNQAADFLRKAMNSNDSILRTAAIAAVKDWPNDSMFSDVINFAENEQDASLRSKAFASALQILTNSRDRSESSASDMWQRLVIAARNEQEETNAVNALANQKGKWVVPLLEKIARGSEFESVIKRAEEAIKMIKNG